MKKLEHTSKNLEASFQRKFNLKAPPAPASGGATKKAGIKRAEKVGRVKL
jgi:hypothetical protein